MLLNNNNNNAPEHCAALITRASAPYALTPTHCEFTGEYYTVRLYKMQLTNNQNQR